MHHNTFSLQNILNEPMDPNLCKRILQEIKSPLMQQSFAMTNDESLSQSWINPPKRPNIPPPSQHNVQKSRRPAIKSKYNSYGNEFNNNNCQPAQSFQDYDHHQQSYKNPQNQYNSSSPYKQNRNFLQGITQRFDSQVVEFNKHTFEINNPHGFLGYNNNNNSKNRNRVQSIVSPLDPNITMKKQQQQNFIMDNIWSQFCGGLFNTGQQVQHQLHYQQEGRSKFQRKKIFDSKAQSLLENTRQFKQQQNKLKGHNRIESILLIKQEKSHIQVDQSSKKDSEIQKVKKKSLKQVLSQLRLNHNSEMAEFLQLICTSIQLLKKAQSQRKFLLQNIQTLYQLSITQQNDLMGIIVSDERYGKFLQRMNFSSLTDMIRKLSRKKFIVENKMDAKQYQRLKNKVSQSLQNMLLNFSQVEKMIEQFMRQQSDSIQKLRRVYKLMRDKFYDQLQTKSTLQQLVMVVNDVRLYKYESQLYQLEYIWDQLGDKVLTQQQFINGIVRMSGVYHSNNNKSQLNNQSILMDSQNRLQSQLSKMGFIKN